MTTRLLFVLALLYTVSITQARTYYVDGTQGSNAYPGSEDKPFATIQKAADVMGAGDNCLIRTGTYRETIQVRQSGIPGASIRFQAYPSESVFITGTDPVPSNRWKLHIGAIYTADMSDIGHVTQVFIDEQRMEIARFPNNTSDDLMSPVWGVADYVVAQEKPALTQLSDPLLVQAGVDFTGGDLWLLTGRKWVSFSTTVESHDSNSISFVFPGDAMSDSYNPQAGSNYFITGLVACIDMDKEWLYHQQSQMLYFQAPDGVHPAELQVHVRSRQWGFDVKDCNYIEIVNLNFFSAAIDFTNAENCLLDGAHVFYPVPFYAADAWASTESPQNAQYSSIKVGGQNNLVKNCEVAHSWGEGIVVFGKDNTVGNCLVYDIDWIGTDAAPIHTSGSGHIITNNTIYNAGRSGIVHRKSKDLEIAYNHIFDCGLLTTDLGATYCYKTDGEGTEIHHNWVHDIVTPAHTAGIYLDNGSSNFLVHHNVVWNTDDLGIQTNLDAHNHQIYNNTIWDCSQAMGGGGGNQILENQTVYNNLSNSNAWFGTDIQQNLAHTDANFIDAEHGDFRLAADSPARDDYSVVATLMNGGFEADTAAWSGAGCDLASITDPVHSGRLAVLAHNRDKYWEGVRQDVTAVLNDHGRGQYTLEAWVKLTAGITKGYLRFKIVDDDGDHYPGTQQTCTSNDWTKMSYTITLNWKGTLHEAVFELMTTTADTELNDLYIDDCALITPPLSSPAKPRGGILIPGITDDVVDHKPDAGAYEYGGTNANWQAGSSLLPTTPDLP